MKTSEIDITPMLNAYPDSVGKNLEGMLNFLQRKETQNIIGSFYILPSVFNTDLDRGFSIIDYCLNEIYATDGDLEKLKELGINLKFDFVLNHASVLSKQFQDIIRNGQESKYKDFFINWNKFWEGKGEMTEAGYIQPYPELIQKMFFRKPGLPILMVRMPDGENVPYWNTFYQEISYDKVQEQELMRSLHLQYLTALEITKLVNMQLDEGKKPTEIELGKFDKYKNVVTEYMESHRKYLGQMDLNIKSPLVWEYYDDTLRKLGGYGAKIVRLDAFAYAPKEPGEKNFLNEPGTWELLEKIQELADKYGLTLLPEIHSSYEEKTYEILAEKGYMTYDFFLPGLLIDAFEEQDGQVLEKWAREILDKKINVVNMLGCHDGIPLLDLKGLISDEQIQRLIDTVVGRGGFVKNLHGQKNIYYQVNATYYSALGEDDRKMLISRAVQLFMPGKPQIWYLDLFAGKNDYEAVKRAGAGGHKEINRTNLTMEDIETALKKDVVVAQLELLRFRKTFPAFGRMDNIDIETIDSVIYFTWENEGYVAKLKADFCTCEFRVEGINPQGEIVFSLQRTEAN
ncbi:glycosidase [Mediterraneibacter gnavus]|uniref:Glycosidase n=1 Tax=Mediterraneibacter gnavus TaxID=33038 RepID=A0A2N5PC77_MEDGN|nr:alpha-amylase family glycosyl hydrolase [Mediterraneibacter gnavus]PLT72746.1 glycosidase [Mediterraneibacter gnavus]